MAMIFILMVCASFVVFFTPEGGGYSGGGSGNIDYGAIYGEPIGEEEYRQAYEGASLAYFIRFGRFPDSNASRFGFDLESETLNRVFISRQVEAYGIEVDDASVAKRIAFVFSDGEGNFNREFYQENFLKGALPQIRMTEADFYDFMRQEVASQHLATVVGMTGQLVAPEEAERLYREDNDAVETAAVFFENANHLDSVVTSPQAISRYYTNMMSRYRLPERRTVTYVAFESTNYWFDAEEEMAKLSDLDSRIDSLYEENGADAYLDDDGKQLAADAAKVEIKAELTKEKAMELAKKEATAFAGKLFEMTPVAKDNLERLAAAEGYLTDVSAPFQRSETPEGLDILTPNFARFAFGLTEEEPIAPPVIDDEEVYLLSLKDTLASTVPALSEVQDQVTEDYKESQARSAARIQASNVYRSLTNSLASGAVIADVCKSNNVTLVDIPAFSKGDTDLAEADSRFDLRRAQGYAFDLEPGEVTNFIPTTEGGFILYVKNKKPVEADQLGDGLTEFVETLGTQRRATAYAEWFKKAQESAKILAPGAGSAETSGSSTNAPSAG